MGDRTQEWQYHTFFVMTGNLDPGADGRTSWLDSKLDQLGRDGWELVTIIGHPRGGTEAGHLVVLKRPR